MNGRTTLVAPGHLEVTITDSVMVEGSGANTLMAGVWVREAPAAMQQELHSRSQVQLGL